MASTTPVPEYSIPAMSAAARREILSQLTKRGGDFELVSQRVRSGAVCRVVRRAPASIVDLLLGTHRFADLEYIAYQGETYTFGDIIQQTANLAVALDRMGVRPGDRVAVCMRNSPEWPAAFFAPIALGAVTVSLNGWWSGEEIEYGLNDTRATVLIADEQRLGRVRQSLPALGVKPIAVRCGPETAGSAVTWEQVQNSSHGADLYPADNSPDDDCLMLYTSGSTAGPKAAVSTHRNIWHAILGWEIENRAQARLRGEAVPDEPFAVQRRMLVTIPFFHVTACHVCMLSALRFGRRLTVMYKWNVDEALEIVDRDQITHFLSVPTVTGDLVRAAAARGRTLPSLLVVGGGGSHRPVSQVAAIPEVLDQAQPSTGWGMTETNAIGTQIAAQDYLRMPTSSGRCSVLMDVKIVDPETEAELPVGETGELLIRGTPVVRGYWNKPDATASAFRDGWFKTGDLAYIDREEFVHFVDRIKDIVIRGGENISCLKVEDALHHCAGVSEAIAFGIPDERMGEELVAVVVPQHGATLTSASIRRELERHVGHFEVPARIVLRDYPLPRIATGKFAKRKVRDALIAELSDDAATE